MPSHKANQILLAKVAGIIDPIPMRPIAILVAAMLAIAGIFALSQLSYRYFESEELTKAAGRLSLYRATVTAEINRFSHLSYVLSQDPFVIATASQTQPPHQLNPRLADFSEQAALDAIYLMDTKGLTISASNAQTPASFVGQNYGFRPYFQDALTGQTGEFYGIGATTGIPGYFIADPVRDGDVIAGVVAIKIDLSKLQQSWREAGENVLLADSNGVVLLASNEKWLYRTLNPLSKAERSQIEQDRQFPDQQLSPLEWDIKTPSHAEIDGGDWLHLTSQELPHGWQLHYFASPERASALSLLTTAAAVILIGAGLAAVQSQRARRTAAALKHAEQEEATLRIANDKLAVEIEERHQAERRLKRTQAELERAGRLAALGRLSASVTHELGQPIAAMRNHLVAAEIGSNEAPELGNKIAPLLSRMEDIAKQLKFFARHDAENFAQFDLADAMRAAIALVEPNIAQAAAKLVTDFGDTPVMCLGSRLRIEQVMTNLLRNAADAVEDSSRREITAKIGSSDNTIWFEVRDTGHGLGQATLAELQEPFTTTRESGRGMGLGLAISADIVQDHGGEMSARNQPSGGAVFRVDLPAPRADETPT